MLTYDYLAGFLILIVGAAIIVDAALARHDERPIDAEDFPEVEPRLDQRFRQAEGQ
jgi:hypothetical protein